MMTKNQHNLFNPFINIALKYIYIEIYIYLESFLKETFD